MIRDGALAFNTSKSRLVRRKCPRWFVAKVASSPSRVWTRLGRKIPALLMRTWSFLFELESSLTIRAQLVCPVAGQPNCALPAKIAPPSEVGRIRFNGVEYGYFK